MTSALVKDSVDSFRKASAYDAVVWTKCAFEACRGFSSRSKKILNRKVFRPVKDVQGTAPFVGAWPTTIHFTSEVSDGAFPVESSGHQEIFERGARSE
ncbi:hypothetical protein XPA_002776 [Xanthoria parietina]